MVTILTKMGQKGQIVIPKAFRQEYGFDSRKQVLMQDVAEGVLIQKPKVDVAEEFARMARKTVKDINLHGIEEQYEERLRRSGLR